MQTPWHDSLPFALWRAHTTVQRRVVAALDGLGVTITQVGLAVHLEDHGAQSASDLARLLRITAQSATTALGQLEARGWVTRSPHPTHGRVILYRLTDAGTRGVADGRARIAALDEELHALLPQRDELAERLGELVRVLDQAEASTR